MHHLDAYNPQSPPRSAGSISSKKKKHSRKDSNMTQQRLTLEQVIGHTATNPSCHSISRISHDLAYISGNTVIQYNYRSHHQSSFIPGRIGHTATCVSYSNDGTLLAVAENSPSSHIHIRCCEWRKESRAL